jgi:hypothetical protein
MPHAITTGDQFLEQISGQLAVQNELLGKLVGVLAPDPEPAAEPDPAPATGEPDQKPAASKKPPAKKAASRKRVTGQ